MQLSSSTSYAISRPQIIREQFDEEVVIVDLDTGSYYSLSGAGGEVWSAIENGASESQIVECLSRHYEGELPEIAAGVQRLLAELQEEELIVARPSEENSTVSTPVANGAASESAAATQDAAARPAFETPILQKFTDMQALLLLDPIHEVDSAGWPQAKPDEPEMTRIAPEVHAKPL